jgi:hypothetical protein
LVTLKLLIICGMVYYRFCDSFLWKLFIIWGDIAMTFRGNVCVSQFREPADKFGSSGNALNLHSECVPFRILAKMLAILIGFSWFLSEDPDKCRDGSSYRPTAASFPSKPLLTN